MRISIIVVIAMFSVFLTFAVYGVITFDLSIKEIKKLHGSRNEAFSFNIMQDLDEHIDKRFTDLNEITKLNIVHETLKKSNEEFDKLSDVESFIAQRELEIEFGKLWIPFIDEIHVKLSEELLDSIQFYKDEYDYDVVEELFITNKYGANIALGSGMSDYGQDDEEWWQITKNVGKYVGNLEFDEKYGSYVTALAFKIEDENGNFIGVMRVVLTLNDMIYQFVNDAEIINLPNRNVILIDKEGKIIYDQGIQDFNRNQPVFFIKSIHEGKNVGTLEFTDELEEVRLISYAKSTGYKTFEGFDWVTLVEQTRSSFVDEFIDLRNSIITVSLVGMIASIVMGIVVSFFITEPLKDIANLAQSISKGKFNKKAKKSKINEINVINDSFNEMSRSLEKLIETEKQLAETQTKVKNERLTAIGEMAASMAHNMKNPLGTIKSSADIIKRNMKGSQETEVLARMDRGIYRISRQIEDVLNFVRITPLNVETVSVKKLIVEAIESIEIPKNITIENPSIDFQIKCDSKKIEVVFMNLILNSIQSIGNKQGNISIRIQEDGDDVIIEFIDSGPGIEKGMLSKIFEPLITTKESGTGLGLSTCRNIIKQHSGSISVRNNPTTFTIKLPK